MDADIKNELELFGLNDLVKRFDSVISGGWHVPCHTESSIHKINNHFGIVLPDSFLYFAKNSKKFGSWFCSFGEDYLSRQHVIRMNSHWRRRRTKRRIPSNLVIINIGFDEDCDCLDLNSLNESTGEYQIEYWNPYLDTPSNLRYNSFPHYIEHQIQCWEDFRKNPYRHRDN